MLAASVAKPVTRVRRNEQVHTAGGGALCLHALEVARCSALKSERETLVQATGER